MRLLNAPLLALTLAAVLTGCGTTHNPLVASPAAHALSAQSAVTDGTLIFDKKLVYKTVDLLGVGPVYQEKLADQGIKTVNDLLLAGAKRTQRTHLAEATGISEKLILTWVDHSDLVRVTGCGPEYARLLERAGVDTVVELARRNSIKLVETLKTANELGGGKHCVDRLPNVITTTKWVDNADKFARIVTY